MGKRPSDIMKEWMGAKQGSAVHKLIIDNYNQIKPLPQGVKMNLSAAWCAATVSAAYHIAGLDSIFPSECSCGRMIEKAKKMGIWIEDDTYIPKKDDAIIYAWNDSKNDFAKTDNKTGHDHVGLVLTTEANIIYVVEGNKGKPSQVGVRTLPVNGRYIRGFISPKAQEGYKPSVEEIAKEVIQGKWSTGIKRRQLLTQSGYDYAEVQKKVNELLK